VPPRDELVEPAPAKVNLTLHVLGRRADGYHELESLVVFADLCDRLTLTPGVALELVTRGPTAAAAGRAEDNLVLKAANALTERVKALRLGAFRLDKRLPIAAGIGGGSADAAAALRLLARANRLRLDDPRLMDAARATGADVPVCVDPRPRLMRGVGEQLSAPIALPKLAAVLVNPGVPVATKDVFALLASQAETRKPGEGGAHSPPEKFAALEAKALCAALAQHRNDLEAPAIALQPVIVEVLAALRAAPGCTLARMSGSGATCFAVFESMRAARKATRGLSARQPGWWVRATALGG
jgi:4-diphosphocytidyl-2-C-methyl-D-erythritol kinase